MTFASQKSRQLDFEFLVNVLAILVFKKGVLNLPCLMKTRMARSGWSDLMRSAA